MEKTCIIYYEEQKGCEEWIRLLEQQDNKIKFESISQCTEKIIYAEYVCIGFLFFSHNGKLSDSMEYLASHLVADKESYYFAICAGGKREISSIRILSNKLKERGMKLSYIYTEFILQKIANDKNIWAERILFDISNRNSMKEEIEIKMNKLTKKELQKEMKERTKEYLGYLAKKKKE